MEGWVEAGVLCLQSSQMAQGDQRDPLELEDTASPPGHTSDEGSETCKGTGVSPWQGLGSR